MSFGIIDGVRAADEPTYDPRGKRDPFAPLLTLNSRQGSGLYGVESAEEISIEGIVFDPKGSVIVVNGSVLKEGEETGGMKVLKIERNGARFLLNGTETYVPLYRDEPKGKNATER